MNEFSNLQKLASRIKNDASFRNRNTSELIKLIPFIGSFIESNTLGNERDKKLEDRLLNLEEIATKACSKDELKDIVNILEQHSLILNRFIFEYEKLILPQSTLSAKKIKVAISFVEQDLSIATGIAKQLYENQIDVISNNFQLTDNLNLTYSKEVTPDTECVILIYSDNYEKYNASSYSEQTILNSAISHKTPIITFAFDEIPSTQTLIQNTFQRVFNQNSLDDIITTFFFDKFSELKEAEQELTRKYSDVKTILKLYNPGFLKILEHDKNKIGFELYELSQITGTSLYCLYIYDNVNYKGTIDFIKNHFKKKDIFKDLFILLNRNRKLDETKRVARFKKLTNNRVKILHIDDFVWNELTSKYFEEDEHKKNNTYVQPYFLYQSKKFDNFNFFENWLYKNSSPTLIITGSGGIGKTAFASILTNRINSANDKTKAIYIDALKISSTILHLSHSDGNIDLYTFYEASLPRSNSTHKIDYELFKINVDNGNIVIIIDGLDEIISRLGEMFNVESFFNSIKAFSNGVGNGKVILTSRNYFWNKSKSPEFNIQSIEILPLDEEKATEFFNKRYPNSPKIVLRAIKLANSIAGNGGNEYIPYVLECVSFIIDDSIENGNGEYYDPDFDSDFLNQNIKNDFILGKLCVREQQRTEQVSVDNQLRLFFEISFNNINRTEFKQVCERVLSSQINDRQVEAFFAHPLIEVRDEYLMFKYDFFKNHIKNIYINLLLRSNPPLSKHHIDILSNYVSYNSSFTKDLCERIVCGNEEFLYRILELIEEIKNSEEISIESKRRSVSSLFIIYLKLIHIEKGKNIENNTIALNQIFSIKKAELRDVFLIDLSCNDNEKIIFDFSDLHITNAFIKSYDYFWQCRFSENTKFFDSFFYNLYVENNFNIKAKLEYFVNIKGSDDSFNKTINQVALKNTNKDKNIISDLHQFFSCFCVNGNVERRITPRITKSYQRNIVNLDILLKVLQKENVIKQYKSPMGIDTIEINKEHKADILKFHSNRLSVGIIKTIFNILKDKIK